MKHISGIRVRLRAAVLASVLLTGGFASPAVTSAVFVPSGDNTLEVRPATPTTTSAESLPAFNLSAWTDTEIDRITPEALNLALNASRCATSSGAVSPPSTLTVIDYSKASTEPRLWVLDLNRRKLLYEELVAHGQGSGDNFATKFSNRADSHQTSLGLFVTDTTYVGRNGYSLRLDGLDEGFNDRARQRAIVMHGAPYVNDEIGQSLGRLGRSHGCPAVRESVARELIDRVKGGSLVFAYYPDPEWLKSSKYLTGC